MPCASPPPPRASEKLCELPFWRSRITAVSPPAAGALRSVHARRRQLRSAGAGRGRRREAAAFPAADRRHEGPILCWLPSHTGTN